MFGKKRVWAILFLLFSCGASAQKTAEIFINDAYSGLPVKGVWLVPDRTEDTLFTNPHGYISDADILKANFVAVGAPGYRTDTLILFKGGIYRIFLEPASRVLNLVGIISERKNGNKLLTPLYGARLDKDAPFSFDNIQMPRFLNTIPGVTWEQRGIGGSAKISVRGAGWRSNFGIRGTRMYIDHIPLSRSDGFGLPEMADPYFFESMEFFKGPAGSAYGGYSGGSLILKTQPLREYGLRFDLGTLAGTNRLLRGQAGASFTGRNFSVYAKGMSMVHRGYREQEYVNRKLYMAGGDWQVHSNHTFLVKLFYGVSNWGLPGDLNAVQADTNRRMANPYSLGVSARLEKNFFRGGITHRFREGERFLNEITFYGGISEKYKPYGTTPLFSGIKDENLSGFGIREVAALHFGKKYPLNFQTGFEYQSDRLKGIEYENKGGLEGNIKSEYDLSHHLFFAFLQSTVQLPSQIMLEAGMTASVTGVQKHRLSPDTLTQEKSAGSRPGFYPYVGLNKKWAENQSFFLRYTQGYTNPTVNELMSEDGFFNAGLRNERMQQAEIGTRGQALAGKMTWGLGGYYHHFNRYIVPFFPTPEAPVRFTNAGSAAQWGVEAEWDYTPFKAEKEKSVVRQTDLGLRYHYCEGRFLQFEESGNDYSGNRIPGTAAHRLVFLGSVKLRYGFAFDMDLTYRSSILLNYQNTDRTPGIFRGNLRASWSGTVFTVLHPEIFFGVNNFTNASDFSFLRINAPGGGYFNPDHGVFFYGGVNIRSATLLKKAK